MHYAFVDESGSEALFGDEHFLVVAVLLASDLREIELAVKRARKRFGVRRPSGEIKAQKAPSRVVRYLLEAIADAPVEILATVVDKQCIVRPPADHARIYRTAVARAVYLAAERQRVLYVCLDRRYTTDRLRQMLEAEIYGHLARLPGASVTINHDRSEVTPSLQATDFVAWSLFQKYVRGDPGYYETIKGKIVTEEIIQLPVW